MKEDAVKISVAAESAPHLITFQSGMPGMRKLRRKISRIGTSGLKMTKRRGSVVDFEITAMKRITERTKYEISMRQADGMRNVNAKSLIVERRFPSICETKIFHIYSVIVHMR